MMRLRVFAVIALGVVSCTNSTNSRANNNQADTVQTAEPTTVTGTGALSTDTGIISNGPDGRRGDSLQ